MVGVACTFEITGWTPRCVAVEGVGVPRKWAVFQVPAYARHHHMSESGHGLTDCSVAKSPTSWLWATRDVGTGFVGEYKRANPGGPRYLVYLVDRAIIWPSMREARTTAGAV